MKKIIFLILLSALSLKSYSFQQVDSLTFNHKEISFETASFDKNKTINGSLAVAFSYLFKLNKRFELGPQLSIASYNIDSLGRFYPLALRGHIKYYFGDLLKMKQELINKLYATSKFGIAYELNDKNFKNSNQYIVGLGTSMSVFKDKKLLIFEVGISEVSIFRNEKRIFRDAFTIGLNFRF